MDLVTFAQIEHFNRIVAERTNEQSFSSGIEREVIYSSFDARQLDRLRQFDPRVTGFSDGEIIAYQGDDKGEG
jgi:glycerophosphoryl diester phosphodiesterase